MAVPAIHPGEHLAEELKALNMSAAALARQLKVPTNRITEILNGERSITGDTALRLAHFFGTSGEFWLKLRATCRIACTSGIFFLRVKHGAGSGADWWTLGPLSDSVELSNNRIRRNDPNGLTLRYYRVTGLAFKRCCSRSLRKRSGSWGNAISASSWCSNGCGWKRCCRTSTGVAAVRQAIRAALARAFIAKAVFALVSDPDVA